MTAQPTSFSPSEILQFSLFSYYPGKNKIALASAMDIDCRLRDETKQLKLQVLARQQTTEDIGRYVVQNFDAACLSGVLEEIGILQRHNGCIWVEIQATDAGLLASLRQELSLDPHTFALFNNVFNDGFILVIHTTLTKTEEHGQYTKAFEQYLHHTYSLAGLTLTSKSESDLCFLGLDPNPYYSFASRSFSLSWATHEVPALPTALHQAVIDQMEQTTTTADPTGPDQAPAGWAPIQPIQAHLLPVLPMRPDMLPDSLRPWLVDIAHQLQCPLDFVAAAAVVMLSSLIGTRLAIKPKSRSDWTVVVNLWGAIIAPPSAMKTPAAKDVFKPLDKLVKQAAQEYDRQMRQYEADQVTYEARLKAFQSQEQKRAKGEQIANPIDFPEPPLKPIKRRYVTNDVTIEKLAELLSENPTGLLVERDELIGLLASWERLGREADRAFYLEGWNGNGSQSIDRIGRGSLYVDSLCLSLFGGIQPAKLLHYLLAATGYENDGFVQRMQAAVYPDLVPYQYVDEHPDKVARDRAYRLIETIVKVDLTAMGHQADEDNKFPYIRFATDAQEVFKQWLIQWEIKVLPYESGLLLEHFTKYRSLVPSLALIFHVVDWADKPNSITDLGKSVVSVEALRMALAWCDYLMSHARRIYGLLDTASVESANALLRHIKKGDLSDGFKMRDVYRRGWSHLKSPEQAEAAVAELLTRNYLQEIQPTQKPGRPEAPHYRINPALYANG